MLQEGVHAQHRVVRLDARRGDLRARPHRERDLRLLAVVDGEALEEQAAETGASTTAARVEDPIRRRTLSLLFGDGALSQAESDLFLFSSTTASSTITSDCLVSFRIVSCTARHVGMAFAIYIWGQEGTQET